MASCSSCGRDIGPGTGNGNVRGYCSECAKRKGITDGPQNTGAIDTQMLGGCLLKLFKAFGILMAISAVVWVVLFFAFDAYKIDYTVTGEASRTAEQFESFLMEMDNKKDVWEIQYDKKKTDILGRVAFWDKDSYTIRYNKGDTTPYTTFVFAGENLGTELPDGTYTLTQIDGANVLVDESNKLIYKAGSEFYKTYAPKLQAIKHDALLGKLFEQVEGGEHGLVEEDPPKEAIFTDNAAITARLVRNDPSILMDHGFDAMIDHADSNQWAKYTFSYNGLAGDKKFDGYTYAE